MNTSVFTRVFFVSIFLMFCSNTFAQELEDLSVKLPKTSRFGDEIRGVNAVSLGIGASIMNGDLANPLFDIYSHFGYKRFLGSSLALNFGYHKFNLAFEDVFNEGFMSFDVNLEWYLMPYQTFTPFVFGGAGYHAANYFETTETKIQAGIGFEYLVAKRVGIKLFGDYNYLFSDETDGLVFGETNDAYWRVAFGLNIYFGQFLKKNKIKDKIPTIIKSNPVVDY